MPRNFRRSRAVDARLARQMRSCRFDHIRPLIGRGRGNHHVEADLPPAGQLDIDLRKQRSIEERAMPDPVAAVHTIARAQRIETMLGTRMPCLGHRQRVDHPRHRNVKPPAIAELGIQKAKVEHRIVGDQRAIAQKIEQILDRVFKIGFVGQKCVAQSVNLFGNAGHCHAGIEIGVIGYARFDTIHELYASDFDDPVALLGVEASGFGIEYNFAHWISTIDLRFALDKR